MTAYDAQTVALWCLIALGTVATLYTLYQTWHRRKLDVRMDRLLGRAELMVDQMEAKQAASESK